MKIKNIRNIALFAHVDAGKTSITERFLFHSGQIKSLGSVDKGSSQTDTLEVEKERGITVNSTILTFSWKGIQVNLIDTPGHIDFSSETEKAISAIDAAIIVVSAVEGVQAQTEKMIELLRKHNKPFLVFINKLDRIGADYEAVIFELENELGIKSFLCHKAINEGKDNLCLEFVWSKDTFLIELDLVEKIVQEDELLFSKYFNSEKLSWDSLDGALRELILQNKITPILLGSAKKGLAIDDLLDAISNYLPNPVCELEGLSAVVFKVYYRKGEGKMSAVRLLSGKIQSRDVLYNTSKQENDKVTLIKNTDLQNPKVIQEFSAGEVAWVQGLKSVEPGDYIGILPNVETKIENSSAFLSVQLKPKNPAQINDLIEALYILNTEDPSLNFEFLKEEQELSLNIRGKVQEEILQSILKSRFNLDVEFLEPMVIYKETPTVTCEGYVRYWLPKPCWAIMKFKIEPGKRGSGIQYSSVVGVNDVKQQYQNDVERSIPFSLKQGVLGWQVDDIKITLIEGEDHVAHTKSNDFSIATPMGIMDGLTKSESTLLEPILSFKIVAPEEFLGTIASELTKIRSQIHTHGIENGSCKLLGDFPLATSINFPIKLSSITSGKGKLLTTFLAYKPCDKSLGKTRKYKGISPLDTSKYILKARRALG